MIEITDLIHRLPTDWQPKSDAQKMALVCPAEFLKFGGAAGSLKSTTLLVKGLTYYERPSYRGIIFRKSYPEISFLIDRTRTLYSQTGGTFYEADKQWRWPWGSTIEFRHLDKDKDVYKHQGPEYQFCTIVGTQVLMEDGSYRAVESLHAGDSVQTPTGPAAVSKGSRRRAACVTAQTPYGSQIQTLDHSLLTTSGEWASYNDCLLYEPKEFHSSGQRALRALEIFQRFSNHAPQHSDLERAFEPAPTSPHLFLSKDAFAFEAARRNYFEAFDDSRQETQQPPSCFVRLALYGPCLDQAEAGDEACYEGLYGSRQYEAQGSLADCPSLSHSRGGQPLLSSTYVQGRPPLPFGAEASTRADHNIHRYRSPQGYTLDGFSYFHPYTKADQLALTSMRDVPCFLTPCGDHEVVDITISSNSQYITMGGFVNKNCGFDESTHFKEFQLRYLLNSRMRTTDNIPLRMVLATNPGGVGHSYHKSIFQGPKCLHCLALAAKDNPNFIWPKTAREPGRIYHDARWPSDSQLINVSSCFIPGRVTDHTLLDDKYLEKLAGLPKNLREALLAGCWEAFEGQYFDCFDPSHHVVERASVDEKEWWPFWVSIDYGFGHATAAYLWTMNPKTSHVYTLDEYIIHRRKAIDVAKDLQKLWGHHNIKAWFLSPDSFDHDGTVDFSKAEIMAQETGIYFDKAYRDRISGAMLMYTMLSENRWSICSPSVSLLPMAMPTRIHAEHDAEDVEKIVTEDEDDAYDACLIAGTEIETTQGRKNIEAILEGDEVYTFSTSRKVLHAWKSGADKPCLRITLSDGSTLTGTNNHPIFVKGQGYIPLDSLRYGDILIPWQPQKRLSSTESNSGDIQTLSTEALESITTPEEPIALEAFSPFIKRFGSPSTDPFQRALTFITETTTHSTTPPIISKPSQSSSISANTAELKKDSNPRMSTWQTSAQQLPHGINQRSDEHGTPSTVKTLGSRANHQIKPAGIVASNTKDSFQDSVLINASLLGAAPSILTTLSRFVNTVSRASLPINTKSHPFAQDSAPFIIGMEYAGRHDVFNLEIEDAHEYFANGILTHNCRYGLASYINPGERPEAEELEEMIRTKFDHDPTIRAIQIAQYNAQNTKNGLPTNYRSRR